MALQSRPWRILVRRCASACFAACVLLFVGYLAGCGGADTTVTANARGPHTGTPNLALTFNGSRSCGSGGQTLTYAWSFGDGGSAGGVAPTHDYAAVGT